MQWPHSENEEGARSSETLCSLPAILRPWARGSVPDGLNSSSQTPRKERPGDLAPGTRAVLASDRTPEPYSCSPAWRRCSCQVHPNRKQKDSQHPHTTPPINGLNAQEGVMTSFAQTVPCFAGWGGRPGSCRLLLSLRNAPTKPIVLSSYVQASGPLDENLLEFFIVLSHKPTPSTLPSVHLPCRIFHPVGQVPGKLELTILVFQHRQNRRKRADVATV